MALLSGTLDELDDGDPLDVLDLDDLLAASLTDHGASGSEGFSAVEEELRRLNLGGSEKRYCSRIRKGTTQQITSSRCSDENCIETCRDFSGTVFQECCTSK